MVIVNEEHVEKDEKPITFLLKLVGKEITELENAKLSMFFFLVNNFLISSDMLVLAHALTANTVTGGPAMVESEFTERKCSEKIVDEKVEGEDKLQVTMLQLLSRKEVVDLGNSNLCCLKLSEFSVIGTVTCTLLAPIQPSKLFLKSLNNCTK